MCQLKLKRIFLVVYFINTNLPEERVQVLLSEKEPGELQQVNTKCDKLHNIDKY